MKKNTKKYIISIATALAVGGASALITMNNMDLYSQINTPPLSPPSVLFPIVWTVLYILMGISAARICIYGKDTTQKTANALSVYGANLAVNFTWSIIFFNFRAFLFSFIWLIFLWLIIIRMILDFNKIDKTASYLQIPYFLWVTFAGYLNIAIYFLNR